MAVLCGGKSSIFGLDTESGEVIGTWSKPDEVKKIGAMHSTAFALQMNGDVWVRTPTEFAKYCSAGTFCVTGNGQSAELLTANEKDIEIWSFRNAAVRSKTIPVSLSNPTSVMWNKTSGGSHAFIGSANGSLTTTSLSNHSSSTIPRSQLMTDKSSIVGISVVTNDRKKIGIAQDSQAILFDFMAAKTVHTWKHHVAPIKSFQFSPVSDILGFTASYDYFLKIFDLRTSEIIQEQKLARPIESAIFQPDGATIIIADLSGFVHKLDLRTSRCEPLHGVVGQKVFDLCVSPDNFDYSMFQLDDGSHETLSMDSMNMSNISDISNVSSMAGMTPPKQAAAVTQASKRLKKNVYTPSPLAIRNLTDNGPPIYIPDLSESPNSTSTPHIPLNKSEVDTFFPAEQFNTLLHRINGLEKKFDKKYATVEDTLGQIKKTLQGVEKTLELPTESELNQNLRAELRVTVIDPLRDHSYNNLIAIGDVKWLIKDEVARQVQSRDEVSQKLDCILNQLQRIKLPYHSSR